MVRRSGTPENRDLAVTLVQVSFLLLKWWSSSICLLKPEGSLLIFSVHEICCGVISASADKDRKLHVGEVPMRRQHYCWIMEILI